MREQIADYLAQGFKQIEVANMLGCEPSVISELINHDEGFKELLLEKKRQYTSTRIANKYDDIEEKTLNAIKEDLPMADMSEKVRVIEAISKIKHANKLPNAGTYTNPTAGITLVFPSSNVPEMRIDEQNRIISLGARTMEPMPIDKVRELFGVMEAQNVNRFSKKTNEHDGPAQLERFSKQA